MYGFCLNIYLHYVTSDTGACTCNGGILKKFLFILVFFISFLAANEGGVKFRLEPYDNLSPKEELSFFVPFPKGVLKGDEDIMLDFPELKIFARKKIIASWEDKSVKVIQLSFRGLEGRPILEGKVVWGTFEKERKEDEEKAGNEASGAKKEPEKLPEWQKEKLKKALGKIDSYANPPEYKVKVLAIFEPRWYCDSKVWGDLFPSEDNFNWRRYERKFDASYKENVLPARKSGQAELSYYDTAHALFQMYMRSGNKEYLYAGHKETKRYIEEEIIKDGQFRGQHVNGKGIPLPWRGLRVLYIEGLVDDYILTGDTSSLEWAKAMGDQFVKNIKDSDLKINERNPGWPTLELLALYNVTGDEKYLNKAKKIIDVVLSWQDASGGWKRVYEDKEECSHGHKGGSAFMTTILCEGLIHYHLMTGDKRVEKALVKAADWLLNEMYMPNQKTFRYIQCPQSTAAGTYSLNPMYIEMLGYATYISKDEKYRRVAREVMSDTVKTGNYANHIKEFAQCFRSSSRGLYWLYKDYVSETKTTPQKPVEDVTKELK